MVQLSLLLLIGVTGFIVYSTLRDPSISQNPMDYSYEELTVEKPIADPRIRAWFDTWLQVIYIPSRKQKAKFANLVGNAAYMLGDDNAEHDEHVTQMAIRNTDDFRYVLEKAYQSSGFQPDEWLTIKVHPLLKDGVYYLYIPDTKKVNYSWIINKVLSGPTWNETTPGWPQRVITYSLVGDV